MNERNFSKKIMILCAIVGLLLIISISLSHKASAKQQKPSTEQSTEQTTSKKQATKTVTSTEASSESDKVVVDWRNSSENKAYPVLQEGDWIDVSLTNQRVKIMRDKQVLYTMICSTGSGGDRATPTGTYAIQGERGETFFNQSSGEGANYWVSWKDHGIYLFHSVPIDASGNYIEKEAEELGQKANSHGCIRLTVADAKWFYEHALYGMKVVIHK